jgi:hypothetical protein
MESKRNLFISLRSIWRKLYGEPVWVEGSDGQVQKSRLIRCKNGELVLSRHYYWQRAYQDGSTGKGYIVKWWPR